MNVDYKEIQEKAFLNFLFLKEYDFSIKTNGDSSFFLGYLLLPHIKFKALNKIFFVILSLFFPFIIFYDFIFLSVKKLLNFNSRRKEINNIYINASTLNEFEIGFSKNIFQPNFVVLEFPYLMKKNSVSKVKIERVLSYKFYVKAFYYSVLSSSYLFFKYGLNGGFYSITSYRFFLLYEFLNTLPKNTNIYFNNQKDRWALLFDSFSCLTKNLIQHGTNIVKGNNRLQNKYLSYDDECNIYYIDMPFKLKNINTLYAYSVDEAKYILLGEQEPSKDLIVKIIGYPIILSPVEHCNSHNNLLIIGCYDLHFKEEVQILEIIDYERWRVFLKPHPTMSIKDYKRLLHQYDIHLITGNYFPDVDLVFSYSSTLAFQYESCGKKVLYYDDIRKEDSMEISESKLRKILSSFTPHTSITKSCYE